MANQEQRETYRRVCNLINEEIEGNEKLTAAEAKGLLEVVEEFEKRIIEGMEQRNFDFRNSKPRDTFNRKYVPKKKAWQSGPLADTKSKPDIKPPWFD